MSAAITAKGEGKMGFGASGFGKSHEGVKSLGSAFSGLPGRPNTPYWRNIS